MKGIENFLKHLPFVALNAAGVIAFALPFIVGGGRSGEASARLQDAPTLMAFLVPLLLVAAVVEAGGPRIDPKFIALLGVLSALTAVMRIPISFAGANLIFFLPVIGGYVFGARFGFLLGGLGMGASAIITAGLGPWLPFQMWALGWVGAGAGMIRPLGDRFPDSRWFTPLVLAAYGYASGLAFGFVMNIYFWPYMAPQNTAIGWAPGLPLAVALRHYWSFYSLTSLAWDAVRGVFNLVILVVAGPAAAEILRRFRNRFSLQLSAG